MAKFHFKDYSNQLIDALLDGQEISQKDLAFDILENLDIKEIIKVMKMIELRDKNFYKEVKQEILNLRNYNDYRREKSLAFVTKENALFEFAYENAKNSLNNGDLIAFLIGKYLKTSSYEQEYIKIIFEKINQNVSVYIAQNIAILESELESHSLLPIDKALYFFFLYDKQFALEKFKKIISKDIHLRRNHFYQIEYFTHIDRFFNKLDLNYIPKIDTVGDKFNIKLADEESSISKSELQEVIDKEDYFNKKVPLKDYGGTLINPSKDITDYKEVEKLFSAIFKKAYIKKYSEQHYCKLKVDLGKLFLSTITDKSPPFSAFDLILTRETIKELLLDHLSNLKYLLFSIIYILVNKDILFRWNTYFPPLFSEYLNCPKGFSKDTIKMIFLHTEKNIYLVEIEVSIKFVKDNSKLDISNKLKTNLNNTK